MRGRISDAPSCADPVQIGKIMGCRVAGVADGAEKCAHEVDNLRFDACIGHKADGFAGTLKLVVPDWIDLCFENVGGAVFDAGLPLLNASARIPVCGLVSQYNSTLLPDGPDRMAPTGWTC